MICRIKKMHNCIQIMTKKKQSHNYQWIDIMALHEKLLLRFSFLPPLRNFRFSFHEILLSIFFPNPTKSLGDLPFYSKN